MTLRSFQVEHQLQTETIKQLKSVWLTFYSKVICATKCALFLMRAIVFKFEINVKRDQLCKH